MARKNKKGKGVEFNENKVVEVTEEELKEGEKKVRKPSKKTLLQKEIVTYLLDHTDDLPGKLQDMVQEFKAIPSRVTGARGPSIAGQLKNMILTEKEIHEDRFFEVFKLGRLEMKRRFYNMRKKVSDPKDAVWVSFNPETGLYKLEGTGEQPPKTWIE